jgi:hypothetical protein
MNIFKPTTFTWGQIACLKWAVFLIGIAFGTTWHQLFSPYAIHLLIVGLLLSVYVGYVWLKQR